MLGRRGGRAPRGPDCLRGQSYWGAREGVRARDRQTPARRTESERGGEERDTQGTCDTGANGAAGGTPSVRAADPEGAEPPANVEDEDEQGTCCRDEDEKPPARSRTSATALAGCTPAAFRRFTRSANVWSGGGAADRGRLSPGALGLTARFALGGGPTRRRRGVQTLTNQGCEVILPQGLKVRTDGCKIQAQRPAQMDGNGKPWGETHP